MQNVVLVGGFSGSKWLFNQVQDQLCQYGLNVSRVEHYAYVVFFCALAVNNMFW